MAIFWLAFALRLYQLGAESLWYDETVSVVLARKSLPALLTHTAGDIHPPGYYLLLHGWQLWVQPSLHHGLEFLFAWPSLWFGLLVVALLYPLARATGGKDLALLTVGLAAVNPFHLWYSQEVRMYTLGAALGLLCLWATWQFVQPKNRQRNRWLLVYLLAAATGLYTLYYFLLLLIPLNLLALWQLWFAANRTPSATPPVDLYQDTPRTPHSLLRPPHSALRPPHSAFRPWLLAQLGVLLLWSPWLPIFWRQAVDPPVPPWRTPWPDLAAFTHDLAETLAAFLVGQSSPGQVNWPWAWLTVAVVGGALISLRATQYVNQQAADVTKTRWILLYTLGPVGLIYLLTGLITPLYHVRYLFTYAPPFMILLALALRVLYRRQWLLGLLAGVGVVVANGWSLQQFWVAPPYRADDHRAAVAALAQAWRPGDAILVNAGWVYPALLTYWPQELADTEGALPPALGPAARIIDDLPPPDPAAQQSPAPNFVRLGSVDGSPRLGWGDANSDFFAVTRGDLVERLDQLRVSHARIWHYRLYDTVSDPAGVVRAWLTANHTLLLDQAIPGRDFLRLQLYQTQATPPAMVAPGLAPPIRFGAALLLTGEQHPATVVAGTTLYVQSRWQVLAEGPALPGALAFSLRLYDAQGQVVAQHDAGAVPPTDQWAPGAEHPVGLALPVPIATKPGEYQLALVVYTAMDGLPLAPSPAAADPAVAEFGMVQVTAGQQAPTLSQVLATFDYLDLVAAAAHIAEPMLVVDLTWQPQPRGYSDTYLANLLLQDNQGATRQQWQEPLGGWNYPSATWPAQIPVHDRYRLPLATVLPPGDYTVLIQLVRNSDQSAIPVQQGWWPGSQPTLALVTLRVP